LVLLAVDEQDSSALRGLGTYGFIRGAHAYIAGAVGHAPTASRAQRGMDLEDVGYRIEQAILFATGLGLGTCWLGGTFTKSRFAERIALRPDELLPAVVAVGYAADRRSLLDHASHEFARSGTRLPWHRLFFESRSERQSGGLEALLPEAVGPFATVLEMVRLAPSASNRQPWRLLRDGDAWHFYVQRTPVYGTGGMRWVGLADLQRVDMGIAMCHFALTADELGLHGHWQKTDPKLAMTEGLMEYIVTWAP
jgi:nitroreductase